MIFTRGTFKWIHRVLENLFYILNIHDPVKGNTYLVAYMDKVSIYHSDWIEINNLKFDMLVVFLPENASCYQREKIARWFLNLNDEDALKTPK